MKRETDIKELLISNAIQTIAQGGFEMATTKKMTFCSSSPPDVKMNESYIYRLFGSKEKLYASAFVQLDTELCLAFKKGMKKLALHEGNLKDGLYELFLMAWNFVLRNEERCRCYVRYYYSIYFKGDSIIAHNKLFEGIVNDASPMFKDEADVAAILHSVFTSLLDFAIRVYNGDLENNDENRPHVFNVLYCMMSTYLK